MISLSDDTGEIRNKLFVIFDNQYGSGLFPIFVGFFCSGRFDRILSFYFPECCCFIRRGYRNRKVVLFVLGKRDPETGKPVFFAFHFYLSHHSFHQQADDG